MNEDDSGAEVITCCAEDTKSCDMLKHCPMAARFDLVIRNSNLGFYLMLFGIVFVLLGVVIVVQPKILVWLAGTTATLLGIILLIVAYQIGCVKTSLQN